MEAFDVVKELVKLGITDIEVKYKEDTDMFYYDLKTGAKSHLHFYDDFHVEGRYDYSRQLDSDQDIMDVVEELFWEFKGCIHGRDFYNSQWMELGVKLGLVEKKVNTVTTVTYE